MAEDHLTRRIAMNPYLLHSVPIPTFIPYAQTYVYGSYCPAPHYIYSPQHVYDDQHEHNTPPSTGQIEPVYEAAQPDTGPLLYTSGEFDAEDDPQRDFDDAIQPEERCERPIKRRSDGQWQEEPAPKKSKMEDLPSSSLRRFKTLDYNRSPSSSSFDRYEPLPQFTYDSPVDMHPEYHCQAESTVYGDDYNDRYHVPLVSQTDHFYDENCQVSSHEVTHTNDQGSTGSGLDSQPQYQPKVRQEYTFPPTTTTVHCDYTPNLSPPRYEEGITSLLPDNLLDTYPITTGALPATTPPSFDIRTLPRSSPFIGTIHTEDPFHEISQEMLPYHGEGCNTDAPNNEFDKEPRINQWRVGKTPGHQGSHVMRQDEDSQSKHSGDKKTLGEVRIPFLGNIDFTALLRSS